jgi:hypothetical protein
MKLGTPFKLEIKPTNGKSKFRFLFWFDGRTQPVEFETSADAAMMIMKALQEVQVQHKLAIPRGPARRGKPTLVLVKSDDE